MKRALKIYCLYLLLQLTAFACNCPNAMTLYRKINSITADNSELTSVEPPSRAGDSSTVKQKDFRIRLITHLESVASNFNSQSFLLNTANAQFDITCDDNYKGLKSDITNIKISCNKDILGTSAGDPIDYNKINVDLIPDRISIDEWLQMVNNDESPYRTTWYFEFNQKIVSDEFLKFKIQIKQEDGSEFEAETNWVKIEQ